MITFLSLCYCILVWLIFFKLKLVEFNLRAKIIVTVIWVVGIGELLVLINLYQPYSEGAKVVQFTTPVVARVSGRIVEVSAQPNVPVKKGDVLFKIDPFPYQYEVDRLKAELVQKEAQRDMDKIDLSRAETLGKASVAALRDVELWRVKYRSSVAAVDRARAKLKSAEIDLAETTVYAPADGFVPQLFLKPGAVTRPSNNAAVMNFVYGGNVNIGAPFPQKALRHIKPGDAAEIALDTRPGKTLNGSVVDIMHATGEGGLTPSGTLEGSDWWLSPKTLILVRLRVDDDISDRLLPIGTGGAVAIYTDRGKALRIIRKIMVRTYAWLNYL